MEIKPMFFTESLSNYSYILMGAKNICIDPFDGPIINRELAGIKIDYLLNTHQHLDHIQGNDFFIKKDQAKRLDLRNGDVIKMGGGHLLEIVETPGHTMDHFGIIHQCDGKQQGFFAGDTIFSGGVGNCKNGGNPNVLYKTIENLLDRLDDDVVLYPGHDYRKNNIAFSRGLGLKTFSQKNGWTTIGEEKTFNPFLRVWDNSFLDELCKLQIIQQRSSEEAFIKLRLLCNNW